MPYSQTLIRRALTHCNTKTELARLIGVTPQALCEFEKARAPLPPERAALLATLAGDDPRDAVCAVMVENARGDLKDRLRRLLRHSAATMAAVIAITVAGLVTDSTGNGIPDQLDPGLQPQLAEPEQL